MDKNGFFIKYHLTVWTCFIFLLSSFGCASYQTKFDTDNTTYSESTDKKSDNSQAIYLIGDAGGAGEKGILAHFDALKLKLAREHSDATLIFLGDNIYPKGMPAADHETRKSAEKKIDAQLDLVKDFQGRVIFIPGNHDYYANQIKGVERQVKYIENKTGKDDIFLPKNGCPLEKVDLNEEAILLLVDSQWYLDNWDKNPTKNDDCDIKTREQFYEEFESLVKKNAAKTTIVAMHHPLFSSGPHGGQFKFSVLASVPNLLRKTSGASLQDQHNAIFRVFQKRLMTLAQYGNKVVFVSGHEHIQELIEKENITQIISGSGSKISASRQTYGSKFSMSEFGYVKLDLANDGSVHAGFYKATSAADSLIYAEEIHAPRSSQIKYDFKEYADTEVVASVYPKEAVKKGKTYTWLWGEHYRKYFGTDIRVAAISLDTVLGGLTPVRKGGGNQSNSLRLKDKDGKEYVLRALKKNAIRFMQSGIFKEQFIEGQYEDTYTEDMLLDVFTTAHPYAPLTVGTFLDAVDIYHPNATLYYVPKQPALLEFNDEFGDELYYLEERAASGHGDKSNFGFSDKIISSDDLLSNLRESDDFILDETTYIRARLMDILLGDWDRHKDQWRWAESKDGKKRTYKPVPRDRDQVYSKYDGALMELTTRLIPAAKKLQVYDDEIRSLKWFNTNPFPVDKALIHRADAEIWLEQAEFIQTKITDEIIENAFSKLPPEVQDDTMDKIKFILKQRLKRLKETAQEYHDYLSRYPVVRGTDKDNHFVIERLSDGSTRVSIYNIKDDKKGTKFFEKTYSPDITKEIWLYGLDDEDIFEVIGKGNKYILIRLIGGQNQDSYKISNGSKVVIHDFKNKKNAFENSKGTIRLTDDYESNLYDFKKNKYNQNQLTPAIGFNPDDGFRLGIKNVFTVFGFNRNPFSSQHTLTAHYYFSTNGFDISYSYELGNVIKNWNLYVLTGATSPNYSVNYYGLGNETVNREDELGVDYHRVKLSAYLAYPMFKWRGRTGSEIDIGGLFEGIEIENTEGRFINTIPDLEEDRQYYVGAQGKFNYENYDNNAFPTLGMGFELEAGWKTNTNGNFDDLTFLIPSLNITHKLVANGKLILASKLKGNLTWGDYIEFYNLASIGGKDGLRGYRNQRFTGNKAFYQNTDLRYKIKEVKTGLLPLQMAVFGGFDYGRVWLNGEDSNSWKTSYGGGFAIVGADMINTNLSLFGSDDGMYFTFGLGFNF